MVYSVFILHIFLHPIKNTMLSNDLLCCVNNSDVEKRKNPVCGFVTPLEGSEADAHRKPEVIPINKYIK